MRSAILAWILIATSISAFSQRASSNDIDLEKLADEIFAAQDLDLDYSELYENLAQIMANPIDLNKASDEELRSLFILNEAQLNDLMQYRKDQGSLLSIYELQTLESIDGATIEKLRPFVMVQDETSSGKSIMKRMRHEENNYLVLRSERTIENKIGYTPDASPSTRYSGSPDHLYARFRVSHSGDFSVGFTMEKDAGEELKWATKQKHFGFDYYSFHAQLLNKGRIKNLIVGDYQVQFGQGLVLGGAFGMGKGSETITTVRRSNVGFLPYTSANEFNFFRGSAITFTLARNLTLNTFGSYLHRDGNISNDLNEKAISSLPITGFHRTQLEIENRKVTLETNYGTVIDYKNHPFEAGIIFHRTNFNIPIQKTPQLYNQFTFTGKENTNASVFFNYSLSNFTFFTEGAQTLHHGKGLVAGMLSSLSPKFDLSLVFRKYDRDYYSFYSNALSENTIPQNESGLYWGWKYGFNKKNTITGYMDMFHFPWLRFRGYTPSIGTEWLLRYTFQPSKQVTFFMQMREESKVRNFSSGQLFQTGVGVKRNYTINIDYEATKGLNLKTRIQLSSYDFEGRSTKGFAILQDVSFDFYKFSISARYALFDTDDFDNRQYAYERDVWLAYSFPAYYGVGVRTYAVVRYRLHKKVDIWVRWANTRYTDRTIIGAQGEAIEGNIKNDVKFQTRIRF